MTVAKKKSIKNTMSLKQKDTVTIKVSEFEAKENNYTCIDDLMKIIDTIELEEQVPALIEDQDLLTKSYKSLLNLLGEDQSEAIVSKEYDVDSNFDFDEKVMNIMTEFLRDGLVNEEELEDFFTEDLGEEFSSDEEYEEYEESSDFDSESVNIKSISKPKSLQKSIKFVKDIDPKKSKNMNELEILMEKVDNESDLDDENYESENESEIESEKEEIDFADNDEIDRNSEHGMKDMFAEDNKNESGRLSSFERSQVTLKSQIESLESENIETRKPWSLRGEINAHQRPSDSLLEEAVEFENLSRPTPQITEERTEEIEDIIKRRIGEAAWDDVERKDGRDLTLLNGMSVSNQKSARALLEDVANSGPKRSLTQVYEEETAKKISDGPSENQEVKIKRDELRGLFAKICRHIDGLSGNRFAPKVYAQSDFQIKTLGMK